MKNFQNKAKIIKVSKVIRLFIIVAMLFWFVLSAVMMIRLPWQYLHVIVSDKNLLLFVAITGVVSRSLTIVVLVYLLKFFSRLKNGHLFDEQTVRYLDIAGKWLIARWLFRMLLIPIALQYFGRDIFLPNFEFEGLLTGMSLICGAWLLKEAQELQEEQELTV